MPAYLNGIPHAKNDDTLASWPNTSRMVAKWLDENTVRLTDERLTNSRPPVAHTHTLTDVEGLGAALDSKVNGGDPRLTDARPPTAHKHPIDDVTGLQAELAGKAQADQVTRLEQRLAALEYDSGPRNIKVMFDPALTLLTGYLQRRGNVISLVFAAKFAALPKADRQVMLTLPAGFRPVSNIIRPFESFTEGKINANALLGSNGTLEFRRMSSLSSWSFYDATFLTNDPIPATLPGTPV